MSFLLKSLFSCYVICLFQTFVSLENLGDPICKSRRLDYQGLQIFVNRSTGLIAFNNASAKVTLAIDLKNDIDIGCGSISGENIGNCDIYDHPHNRGVYVSSENTVRIDGSEPNNTDPTAWHLQHVETLEIYFNESIVPDAEHFDLNDIPDNAMNLGNFILEHLIGGPIPNLAQDPYAGVILAGALVQTIRDVIHEPLRGILPFLNGKLPRGSLIDFTNGLVAFADLADGEFVWTDQPEEYRHEHP